MVYRYIWVYCPNLSSMLRYDLAAVEYEKCDVDFASVDLCKAHAETHTIDIPACYSGPFLYIVEYDCKHDILESITLVQ